MNRTWAKLDSLVVNVEQIRAMVPEGDTTRVFPRGAQESFIASIGFEAAVEQVGVPDGVVKLPRVWFDTDGLIAIRPSPYGEHPGQLTEFVYDCGSPFSISIEIDEVFHAIVHQPKVLPGRLR